jgi:cysteine synthase
MRGAGLQMPRRPAGRIYEDITDTVGRTPVVRLSRLARTFGVKTEILAKLEFFSPMHSVMDRIGVAMIDVLETGTTAFDMARKPATLEGIPAGISSGAAIAAVMEHAIEPGVMGKRLLAILPRFAERYLSTLLFDGG